MTMDWEQLREYKKLSDQAVKMDRWDRSDWAKAHRSVTALQAATEDLQGMLPTGTNLMADLFALLMKAAPELHEREAVRPEGWLQHAVAGEVPALTGYNTLRRFTRGSEVDSALACVSMEPDIETLVDRQRLRQQEARRLQDQLDALRAALDEQIDIDQLIEAWTADHDGEDVPGDLSDRQADAGQSIADLQQQIAGLIHQLDEASEEDASAIRGQMAVAMNRAASKAKQEAQMAAAVWGTEPGHLRRLSVEDRLELARRLDNQRIRDIAEKFGAIHNLSMADRMHRNPMMVDEVVGITLGRDLTRVLPSEFAKLLDPNRKPEFYRDYVEGRLLEFEYDGIERSAKGNIILLKDISGSMDGAPERWATAFQLNLMDIARQEKRGFYLIDFGAQDELYEFDFTSPEMWTTERIFASIEAYSGFGTNFESPLTAAVARLQDEHRTTGRVAGDIVMITDGICGVRDRWKAWFHEEADRLGFTTWGVNVAAYQDPTSEPLYGLCEGKVFVVKDFAGGTDVRAVFQGV